MAEDRRALGGLVGPLALEHPGAVVQPVRQYVDLRVLPGNHLPVVPDQVRFSTACSSVTSRCLRTASVASRVLAAPPRSCVRRPSSERTIDGRFYRRRLRLHARVRGGASARPRGTSRAGWRSPAGDVRRRAVHGLEQPGRTRRAERCAREHPDRAGQHRRLVAEDVAEHVLGEDHVEVTRRGDQPHRRVVDEQVLELDVRELRRVDLAHDLAPQTAGLEHVGLVDARHAGARSAERDPRDPLDLLTRVRAEVRGASAVRVFSPK